MPNPFSRKTAIIFNFVGSSLWRGWLHPPYVINLETGLKKNYGTYLLSDPLQTKLTSPPCAFTLRWPARVIKINGTNVLFPVISIFELLLRLLVIYSVYNLLDISVRLLLLIPKPDVSKNIPKTEMIEQFYSAKIPVIYYISGWQSAYLSLLRYVAVCFLSFSYTVCCISVVFAYTM